MGLLQSLRRDTVGRLPLREAILLPATTRLRRAIAKMRSKQLGCVVAVKNGLPLGIFTEHSIVSLLLRSPAALDLDSIEQHLDENWACVKQTDPIAAVIAAMRSQDLRFVVVTDDVGQAVAITGQKGVMEYIAEYFPRVIVQRSGSTSAFSEA